MDENTLRLENFADDLMTVMDESHMGKRYRVRDRTVPNRFEVEDYDDGTGFVITVEPR